MSSGSRMYDSVQHQHRWQIEVRVCFPFNSGNRLYVNPTGGLGSSVDSKEKCMSIRSDRDWFSPPQCITLVSISTTSPAFTTIVAGVFRE
eukprot:m.76385 g.76385  ORF g.76385 m.76385 type:complete len:90 (-) comp24891_c1_seq4:1008-1277(-)